METKEKTQPEVQPSETPQNQPKSEPKPKKSKKGLVIVIVLIVVLGVASVAGYLVYRYRGNLFPKKAKNETEIKQTDSTTKGGSVLYVQ